MSPITYSLLFLTILTPMFFPLPSMWKMVKDAHSIEYDWLGPDLIWNTQGWCILIFPVVLITPIKYGLALNQLLFLKLVSHYPPLLWRLLLSGYVPRVQCQRSTSPPPWFWGIWTSYSYHISIFITILRLSTLEWLETFS